MIRIGDIFYRYEDVRRAKSVDHDSTNDYVIEIHLVKMKVIKVNSKSITLDYYGQPRRVTMTAKVPWACANKEDAFAIYKKRKINQISYLSSQLNDVRRIVNKLDGGQLSSIGEIQEVEA